MLSIPLLVATIHGYSQNVISLSLIDANTNTVIRTLALQDTIDLAEVGGAINIRANVSGTVGSVRFGLNSQPNLWTESTAPYALAGDLNGDYYSWNVELGMNTITATSYTGASATGTAGTPYQINLLVEDSDNVGDEGTVYQLPVDVGTGAVTISGELKKWHKITLSFDGPTYREIDFRPSPFLDYRLNVTFTNGIRSYTVPGYFAADGNAAETSADSGNVWRVHFSPDAVGDWNYLVSMRLGGHVATSNEAGAGIAVPSLDGVSGTITITDTDKTGRDNRAKGRLQYIGAHYLKYAETGELFIKGGPDAPENFLAYEDFDNTPNYVGANGVANRKTWAPHAADYHAGDPSWQGGKGTEIIGALNYLASEGLNAFSFLTMNINGDDKNVYPYVSNSNVYQFDCSKLDQWEVVFTHADSLGMYLHFKTQETENEMLLDNGDTGSERKLYYRELIARFGHHLALNWNLGEENGHYGTTNQTTDQRKAMADYFAANDPYQHHIVLHTAPGYQQDIYPPLLGAASKLTGVSIQTNWNNVHSETATWVQQSANAGKRWVVANDEQGGADIGVPDDTYAGSPSLADIRKQTLWGNLMAGGAGVEYYFGYNLPQSDLNCQDYRSRNQSWDYMRYAIEFFRDKPIELMIANDGLVSTGWCLAHAGSSYIIYLPGGGTCNLTLPNTNTYTVKWFNPRSGGAMQDGDVTSIQGSGSVSIGNPPSEADSDWAVWITQDLGSNTAPVAEFSSDTLYGTSPLVVTLDARSSYDDGSIVSYDWDFGDGFVGSGEILTHTFEQGGFFQVVLTVEDNEGAVSSAVKYIEVEQGNTSGCGTEFEILSREFPYTGTSFYLDTYTGTELLAINPTPPNPATATVSKAFTGESCRYNVILHAVGENDGQSEFTVNIGDQLLGTFVVPLSAESWEIGAAYNATWEGVEIENGDLITVHGATASNDTEWSRARWLKIEFVPSPCPGNGFIEENGLLVIEAEALSEYSGGWEIKSSISGASNGSYIEYTGSDNMSGPNAASTLEFPITITTPGTYRFKWRSRNGEEATAFDQENDTWLNIECDFYYGVVNGITTPLSDDYAKVWIQSLSNWSWDCYGEHGLNGMALYARFNEPGEYTINIAGRSRGHVIDRIVLYQADQESLALNVGTPVSVYGCGSGSGGFASPKVYTAEQVIESFTIDGNEESSWTAIATATGAYNANGGTVPDEADISGTFKVAYDYNNLYFIANVTDDAVHGFTGSEDMTDCDNITLSFNPDNRHQEGGDYGNDAIQIQLTHGVSDNSIVVVNGTWQAGSYSGVKYSSVLTSGGYRLEAKLPWDGILPSDISVDENLAMGFEVSINDKDHGSSVEQTLAWANNTGRNNAGSDTRCFGTLYLDEGPIICPGDPGCSGGKSLNVYRFNTPPTIDADAAEWLEYEAHAGEYEMLNEPMPSAADLSYSFKVGWTDTDFYILLDAKDNSLNALVGTDVAGWDWDNMEVFFNPDNRHEENGAFGEDAMQMRMNYGRTDNLYSGNGVWKGGANHAGFEFRTTSTSGGYIIEGKIPWRGAFPSDVTAVAGHTFGFDVAVADNDNGSSRENMIAWANDTGMDLNSRDTRVFGFATLVGRAPGEPSMMGGNSINEEVAIYLRSDQMLRVENAALDSDIKVYSSIGQLLEVKRVADAVEEVNIVRFPSGVYVVKTSDVSKLIMK